MLNRKTCSVIQGIRHARLRKANHLVVKSDPVSDTDFGILFIREDNFQNKSDARGTKCHKHRWRKTGEGRSQEELLPVETLDTPRNAERWQTCYLVFALISCHRTLETFCNMLHSFFVVIETFNQYISFLFCTTITYINTLLVPWNFPTRNITIG